MWSYRAGGSQNGFCLQRWQMIKQIEARGKASTSAPESAGGHSGVGTDKAEELGFHIRRDDLLEDRQLSGLETAFALWAAQFNEGEVSEDQVNIVLCTASRELRLCHPTPSRGAQRRWKRWRRGEELRPARPSLR